MSPVLSGNYINFSYHLQFIINMTYYFVAFFYYFQDFTIFYKDVVAHNKMLRDLNSFKFLYLSIVEIIKRFNIPKIIITVKG